MICESASDRSTPITFKRGTISINDLDIKLNNMLNGMPQEIDEAFVVVFRCLVSKPGDSDVVNFIEHWLQKNISAMIPRTSKYYAVKTCQILFDRKDTSHILDTSKLNKLIAASQPIPEEDQGTWHEIEQYMVDQLHNGEADFRLFLEELADVNAVGLSKQFEGNKFRYLISEICKSEIGNTLTKLLLSSDRRKRKLAMLIIRRIETVQLSKELLNDANETQLQIILLQFIVTPLVSEQATSFLLSIEPAFRTTNQVLQQRFVDELTHHAIDYPGTGLRTLKDVQQPSHLIQNAILRAEKYFENLVNVRSLTPRSFVFSRFAESDEKAKRALSQQINKSMREHSTLISLIKHIHLIYGSTWCDFIDGKLTKTSQFAQIAEEVEFPRLEYIDPEGMKIKRINAAIDLVKLESQH